jgi:short subunit dehydrogenase-like uncharacterized protein
MNPNAEFDIVVYGVSGYTGRLVAEHLAQRYGVRGELKWAIAGRSAAKLAEVRDDIGAPAPMLLADAADLASQRDMVHRAKAVVTTVGPYQLGTTWSARAWKRERTTLISVASRTGCAT